MRRYDRPRRLHSSKWLLLSKPAQRVSPGCGPQQATGPGLFSSRLSRPRFRASGSSLLLSAQPSCRRDGGGNRSKLLPRPPPLPAGLLVFEVSGGRAARKE